MRKYLPVLAVLVVQAVFAASLTGCISNSKTSESTGNSDETSALHTTSSEVMTSASAETTTVETTAVETTSSAETTSAAADTAAPQEITFYYPRMTQTDIEILYKKIPVEIKPGEDITDILTVYFRTPVESGLHPIMSQNTVINSITPDAAAKTVTIDLSSEFVSEMNVGSGMEAAILRCLVNTVGSIYSVQDVIVTLDGQLYESGHIALAPGETFKTDYKDMTELT